MPDLAELAFAAGFAAATTYGKMAGNEDAAIKSFTLMKVIGRDLWIGIWSLVFATIATLVWEKGQSGRKPDAREIWWRFPKFVIGFFATLAAPDGRLMVGGTTRQFVMVGLCGGYTTFSSFSLQTLNLMRGGKVRGVAVTSKERHPAVPDVPTMGETLPGFEITSWGGICGPAGLPPAMVEKCSELARKALDSPRVKTAFEQQGATAFWMNPKDTGAYRLADEKKLAPVIKASGAKVE